MSGEFGLKETKEMLKFGIDLGEAFDTALADGKIGLEDAAVFFSSLMSAKDAFDGIDMLPKELGDMDSAEADELKEFVATELNISNDKVEQVIEETFGLVLKIYSVVQLFRHLKDAPAGEQPVEA